MGWQTILKAILPVVLQYTVKLFTKIFGSKLKGLYLSVTKRGGNVMFLNAFKLICNFISEVIAIVKEGALKDIGRWVTTLTPLFLNAKPIYDGCLEFFVAINDPAIVSECAKYFDESFELPGKLEEVDQDLAEVLMKSVKIVLAVIKKDDPAPTA